MAWGMFCAIPCGKVVWDESRRRSMLFALPLVGLIIGAITGLCWLGLSYLAIPTALKAAFLTALPVLLTGGIHADGYMDVCDATLSRRDRDEKLRILKDSRSGSFAVLSIVLYMIVYFAAMYTICTFSDPATAAMLMIIPCITRAFAVQSVFTIEPLSSSQYSEGWHKDKAGNIGMIIIVIVCMVCGAAICAVFHSLPMAVCLAAAGAGCLSAVTAVAKSLGGMSGDVSGHLIMVGELSAVVVLAIFSAFPMIF